MDLTKVEYFEEKINGINITEKVISDTYFEECDFSQCTFINCQLNMCRFLNCTFTSCMFSAINPLGSRFIDTTFTKSKVLSFDWSQTQEVRGLVFINSQLDYSNFRMIEIPKLIMTGCIAKGASFEDVNLTEADFSDTDLEEAVFFKANLTKANFKGARNYVIDPNTNKLKKTRFSYPDVMSLLTCLDIIVE
ncbi:pentapeptide repeat-containing protein [candidate division WWE3 bacterium]|nr:pentapeptide repeat-containing protein [candidate division WWE3 bacterium]